MSDEIIEKEEVKAPIIPEDQDFVHNQTLPSDTSSSTNDDGVPNQTRINNLMLALRTKSQTVRCPYCEKTGDTQVEKKCNTGNVLCAVFTSPVVWVFFQMCRGKDYNCTNAVHTCQHCQKILGDYKTC